jgi:hypothetical protein
MSIRSNRFLQSPGQCFFSHYSGLASQPAAPGHTPFPKFKKKTYWINEYW